MVDLHTHILPGVDDGSETLENSMEMLEIAVENGTSEILLTPHYLSEDSRYKGFSKDELFNRFVNFKEKVYEKFPGLNLYFGAEVYGINNIEDAIACNHLITINNTSFILLEFGFFDQIHRALNVTDKIVSAGFTPIIAHPERYDFIKENPASIAAFVSKGALLQVNASSLLGYNGLESKSVAEYFIDDEFVSVISSDAHNTDDRGPNLLDAYSVIASQFSSNYANKLFDENPKMILSGRRP